MHFHSYILFVFSLFLSLIVVQAAPIPSPLHDLSINVRTEVSRAVKLARMSVEDRLHDLAKRISGLSEEPREDMVLARSLEDTIYVSVRGAAPGAQPRHNQIIARRDGVSGDEVFNLA
ncbi:hypothetical protein DL96DRAFT_1550832 [Flagelloscypha sp. PMI_526]|nr:hypothetical protein DL96DRAFT_1550832 [Flagelloscypha sp. PMI_526]